MNHCDLILNLVDKYIAEKEKNIILQQQLQQQIQDKKQVKTNNKQYLVVRVGLAAYSIFLYKN